MRDIINGSARLGFVGSGFQGSGFQVRFKVPRFGSTFHVPGCNTPMTAEPGTPNPEPNR
jgi:hypothetical protein